MQLPKRTFIVATQPAERDDKEVAITRGIAVSERERAGEIDADKVLGQDRPNGVNEPRQEIVQLGKPRCDPGSSHDAILGADLTFQPL
jgi:hypothetical protein